MSHVADPASESAVIDDREEVFAALEHLGMAGPVVATLPTRARTWSPEKRLAGAILASALVELRDHHGARSHRHVVVENLRWVASEDSEWPFSFIRLCELFDLEPSWVRAVVERWMSRGQPDARVARSAKVPARSDPQFARYVRGRARNGSARRAIHTALA